MKIYRRHIAFSLILAALRGFAPIAIGTKKPLKYHVLPVEDIEVKSLKIKKGVLYV